MSRKLILLLALVACLALPLGHLAAQDDTPLATAAAGRLLYNGLSENTIEPTYSPQEIFTINADGTSRTRLTFNGYYDGEASWSPDGTRIAFVAATDYPYQLYVMNADGSNPVHLVDPADDPSRPTWSPDGTKLAFTVNGSGQLYIVNSDGTGLVAVEGVSGTEPSWSPDGQLIAFAALGVNNRYDIFVVKPDGTGLTNLTRTQSHDWSPDWSPDGSHLAFYRDFGGGNYELYTMNRSGGERVRLTNTARRESWPSWSPDGQQIAYVAWTPNENPIDEDDDAQLPHIFIMNADGSNPTQITNGRGEYYPDWQPASGLPMTFTPTNDAYVMQAKPNSVFGTKPVLQVKDAAKDVNSYVKFNVTGLTGTVQSATLRLWVTNAGPDGGAVYAVSPYYLGTTTQWLETGLKWNNAPAISGAPLGSLGPVAAQHWVELDVTAGVVAALNSGSRVSFALSNDSADTVAYSSLSGVHPPELVIITD